MGFVLYLVAVILLPVETWYAQHHLNRLWQQELDEEGRRSAGMRGEPAASF